MTKWIFVFYFMQARAQAWKCKGRLPVPDLMNFRKSSEGGGGHFRSEKFRCGFFENFGAVKTMNFRKKGGGSRQSE